MEEDIQEVVNAIGIKVEENGIIWSGIKSWLNSGCTIEETIRDINHELSNF